MQGTSNGSESNLEGGLVRGGRSIIFTINPKTRQEFLDLVGGIQQAGITVKFIPDFYEVYSIRMEIEEIEGIPVVQLKKLPLSPWENFAKRCLDVGGSALGLALTSPLILVIVSILRFSKKRPIFTKDRRIGRRGEPFLMCRFSVEEEGDSHPLFSRFFRFLDRYSLADVPQLWNVLRGHMRLVGPRPENPKRVARYSNWNQRRLLVLPGITGMAQINGLRGFSSSDEKTSYDMAYMEKQSFLVDLLILLQTPLAILKRSLKPPRSGPRRTYR